MGGPLETILVIAALSLVPFVLVMLTSFVKISVVLSLLRSALGTPQVPPTLVITGLALVLTLVVMAPVGAGVYEAIQPDLVRGTDKGLTAPESTQVLLDAAGRARAPVRAFLVRHARPRDRAVFADLVRKLHANDAPAAAIADDDLLVLMPAFVTSELKAAFTIGFLLFLPFLIIDLLVAAVLQSLGMTTLAPGSVALPFKLLLFVLVDGWLLLARGLILAYA